MPRAATVLQVAVSSLPARRLGVQCLARLRRAFKTGWFPLARRPASRRLARRIRFARARAPASAWGDLAAPHLGRGHGLRRCAARGGGRLRQTPRASGNGTTRPIHCAACETGEAANPPADGPPPRSHARPRPSCKPWRTSRPPDLPAHRRRPPCPGRPPALAHGRQSDALEGSSDQRLPSHCVLRMGWGTLAEASPPTDPGSLRPPRPASQFSAFSSASASAHPRCHALSTSAAGAVGEDPTRAASGTRCSPNGHPSVQEEMAWLAVELTADPM